jgi:hypothetical protein
VSEGAAASGRDKTGSSATRRFARQDGLSTVPAGGQFSAKYGGRKEIA